MGCETNWLLAGDDVMNKLGHFFVIGFDGTHTTPALRSFIKEEGIGGVILFKRNIVSKSQLRRLVGRLQEEAEDLPLFISIDQEGGRVQRLPESFGKFPSMADVAREVIAKDDPVLAYSAAEKIADVLRSLGFNLDFAPVLDVATNPFNPIIGDRSFGKEAEFVAELGVQFIQGLIDNGVCACGKHFPGHGDTDADSHLELPILNHTKKRFEACEWKPFRRAIEEGIPALMTSHLLVPCLDSKNPVTVSKIVTNNILRNELGFNGVIFTDDLTMAGIEKVMPTSEAAVKSFKAGADIILICEDMDKQMSAVDALKRTVDSGEISQKRLDDSYQRIINLKNRFCTS